MTAFKKKVLAFALAGTFALSQTAFVSAAVDATETTNINKYNTVRDGMKLIEGDGKEVTLHKPLERYRAFVLYARMLGMSSDLADYVTAFDPTDKSVENFTDAAGQSPYVTAAMAYFKENALSGGGNKGEFRPHDSITGQEFYKMMLEALGYKQDVDFTYDEVAEKAVELGLITDVAVAGSNKLEEIEIGAALYDTLNTNVKPTSDAAVDAPGVKLAYQLALANEDAVAYLAALDKDAPTLTVTEPHAFGRDANGSNAVVADGNTVNVDISTSATVNMHEGMPLIGSLSEPGTIYYDYNGVTGSFKTNENGKFDTSKMTDAYPEGSVKGYFPFINNTAANKNQNVVKMWATDLAGNKTKVMNWANLSRTPDYEVGGNYVASGSSLLVSGSSVQIYFTADMETTPTVEVVKASTDKIGTGTEVKATAITAAEVPATLTTALKLVNDPDVKVYTATITLAAPTNYVKIGGTSSANYGSVKSGNGKSLTFVSQSVTALYPTVDNGSAGGFNMTFNTAIDPDSVKNSNFSVDANSDDTKVVVAEDAMSVYVSFKGLKQTKEYTVTAKGVKSADGQYTMADYSTKVTINDVTNPTVVSSVPLSPNRIRLYLSESFHSDSLLDLSKYTLDGTQRLAAIATNDARTYVDLTAYSNFSFTTHTLTIDVKDDAAYPFNGNYQFTTVSDTVPPVPSIVKATNNFVKVKFSEIVNVSSIKPSNVDGATAVTVDYDTRGMQVATYYLRTANYINQQVSGQITIADVQDLLGNKIVRQTLAIPVIGIDSAVAKATLKQDKVAVATSTGIGNRDIIISFDRPVTGASNTNDNFKLYKGTTLVPIYFVASDPVYKTDGTVFGYKSFKATGVNVAAGDYTVKVTGIVDQPSGVTIPEAVTNVLSVVDNQAPVLNSVYYNVDSTGGAWLYAYYSTKVDSSALVFTNYTVSAGAVDAYGAYLQQDTDRTTELVGDGKVAKLAVKNFTLGSYVTVRGVRSINGALIDVSTSVAGTNNQANGLPPQPTVLGAAVKILGPNTLQLSFDGSLGTNVINSFQLNDIKLNLVMKANVAATVVDLAEQYYPTTIVSVGGSGANTFTKIVYTFPQNIFTKDGKVAYNGGYYDGIVPKTNNTTTAMDSYGQKLLANTTAGGLGAIVDGIPAAVARTASKLYTTGSSVVFYVGYNENINLSEPTSANYSIRVTDQNGTLISPAAVTVSVTNDQEAYDNTMASQGLYNGTTNYFAVGNAGANVLAVTINTAALSGVTSLSVGSASLTSMLGLDDASIGGGAISGFAPVTVNR